MARNDLSIIPTEELKKRAKQIKLAVIFIGISVVLTAISSFILSISKGFGGMSILAISLFSLVIIFSAQLRNINVEIKKRVAQ